MAAGEHSNNVVFISYAHENENFRTRVGELAKWLSQQGCEVLSDHRYKNRAPEEGWPVWMQSCIRRANTVLVICTPRLKQRYEGRTDSSPMGKGVKFEGAIATQHLYGDLMRNDRFVPILPDDGSTEDIPLVLKQWDVGLRFPSQNTRILESIREGQGRRSEATQASSTIAESSRPNRKVSTPGKRLPPIKKRPAGGTDVSRVQKETHQRLALKALQSHGGDVFLAAHLEDLDEQAYAKFPARPKKLTAEAVVSWYADLPFACMQELFYSIRRTLNAFHTSDLAQVPSADQVHGAAAALYCLAAAKWCDRYSAELATASPAVKQVPSADRMICAVVAASLAGGRLELLSATDPGRAPTDGIILAHEDDPTGSGMGALAVQTYVSINPNARGAVRAALKGELDPKDRHQLISWIGNAINVLNLPVAVVVNAGMSESDCNAFSAEYKVTVLRHDPGLLPTFDEYSPMLLAEEVQRFVEACEKAESRRVRARTEQAAGAAQVTTYSQSSRQELEQLGRVLDEMKTLLTSYNRSASREEISRNIEAARKEVDNPRPVLTKIKDALEVVQPAADALEGGERIVSMGSRALDIIARLLPTFI